MISHLRQINSLKRLRIIALLCLILGYIYAFIAGFRIPNEWTMNYFIPSFYDGFYRRGLLGTLLTPFGDIRVTYYFIYTIQAITFILLNVFIIRALWRNTWMLFIYSAFLISPMGGYFFHCFGYVEQFLYLITFFLLIYNNLLLGTIILIASLFIHEISIFTIFPVYFGYYIYNGISLKKLFPYMFISLLFIGILFLLQKQSIMEVELLKEYIIKHANYGVRIDFYYLFSDSFSIEKLLHPFYKEKHYHAMAMFIPMYLFCGYLFWQQGRSTFEKYFLSFVGIIVPLCPLIVGFIAWDCERWLFLSVVHCIMCAYFARAHLNVWITSGFIINLLYLFCFLNLFYFDGYEARNFLENGKSYQFFQKDLQEEIYNFTHKKRPDAP